MRVVFLLKTFFGVFYQVLTFRIIEIMNNLSSQFSKYRISRRGRKLHVSDDSRTLIALPKEVPEKIWAEILQKEENDLVVFEIREELLEEALQLGYERYMRRQEAPFTAHCAAQAWLSLIDWQFYKHDPGEEPSARPPCHIPGRAESWRADPRPGPSPMDSWCRQDLAVLEDASEEPLKRWPSDTSLDYPLVEPIPQEYWFPGRVKLYSDSEMERREAEERVPPSESQSPAELAADSELLQKVTDYSAEELSNKDSTFSALKTTTPVEGSLRGAGDSGVPRQKKRHDKIRSFSRTSVNGRSRGTILPALDSRSRGSVISDCRLRNLRLDTQYEISSEVMDTPPGELVKRK